MGAGKTAVSEALAEKLCLPRISTDDFIVNKEKQTIADIFRIKGESYFRQIEKEAVFLITQKKGVIIDCGGGVVLSNENVSCLRKSGIVIYLKASVDEILERTKDQRHRPLLNTENPRSKAQELLKAREPLYLQADVVVDTDKKSIEDVLKETLEALKQKLNFEFS